MQAKKILWCCLLSTLIFTNASIGCADAPHQQVRHNGSYSAVQAPEKNFTGTAWLENLFSTQNDFTTYAAKVYFTPGARTKWHIHGAGQVLIVTSGYGYTQEWGKPAVSLKPGDVVWCPPGVKHWHGAGPDTAMSHIAISQVHPEGVTWLEPVADKDYLSLKEE